MMSLCNQLSISINTGSVSGFTLLLYNFLTDIVSPSVLIIKLLFLVYLNNVFLTFYILWVFLINKIVVL